MVRSKYLNIGAALVAFFGLAAVFIGSAGDSYASASLLTNGTFNTTVSNWTAGANTSLAHEPTNDYNDDSGSGSGTVTYTGVGVGDATVVSDCINLTTPGDGTYNIEGQAQRNPASWNGQGTPATSDDPTVEIIVTRYDDTGCTTNAQTSLSGSISLSNDGWFPIPTSGPGTVNVSGELGITVTLVIHGEAQDDEAYFDEVHLSNGILDTPTTTNTPTATNTSAATSTPTATDTPTVTTTAEPTETEVPVDTPMPTNTTAPATSTPVPPTATKTTAVVDTGAPPEADLESGVGAGGEQPEDGVGASGEQPEDQEFPDSGSGPGSYGGGSGGSPAADVIATFSFALAIAMLGMGFYLRRKYETQDAQ